MPYSIDALIAEMDKHEGYLEKKTAAKPEIFDKTANAGNQNYNMFAMYFDEELPNWHNGRKNTPWCGWCAMWVSYCFVKAYGPTAAQKLLCIPSLGKNNYFASPNMAEQYFKKAGRWFDRGVKTPQKGDVILFNNSSGKTSHIGIVTGCANGRVYTQEGNTSSVAGMDANGGCCRKKSYAIYYNRIKGYGRPDYGAKPTTNTPAENPVITPAVGKRVLSKGCAGDDVRTMQRNLMTLGYNLPKFAADGDFGAETEAAVKKFQKDQGLNVDGLYGEKTHAAMENALKKAAEKKDEADKKIKYVGLLKKGRSGAAVKDVQSALIELGYDCGEDGADGKYGPNTEKAVRKFQEDHPPLEVDGLYGEQTHAVLLEAITEK